MRGIPDVVMNAQVFYRAYWRYEAWRQWVPRWIQAPQAGVMDTWEGTATWTPL